MSADVMIRLRERNLFGLVEEAAQHYHVTTIDICGRSRSRTTSAARQAVWTRLRAMGLSLPEIGALFGRDHSTILQGLARSRSKTVSALAGKRVA